MWRRITVPLAAAIACVALAACGSSNSNSTTTTPLSAQQYKQYLQRVGNRDDQAHRAFDQSFHHANSVAQLQQALTTFATEQERVAAQLSSVTPPQNAQAAADQFVKAYSDTAAAIRAVLPQVANAGSPQAALAVIQKSKRARQAGQELDAAIGQLKKLGYTHP
jgi:hypothetical protein